MARYNGTTAQRGLGADHQADRKRLLAMHRDGDPCWRCGQPMYKSQPLDRDHIVDRALGGAAGPAVLAHTSCNRSAGAKLGNQLRPLPVKVFAGRDTICAACGKVYSRAPRRCEICGGHYHPNHGGQRTCSRACGVVLRRRKYGGRQSSKPPTRAPRLKTAPNVIPPKPRREPRREPRTALELLDDPRMLRQAARNWRASRQW